MGRQLLVAGVVAGSFAAAAAAASFETPAQLLAASVSAADKQHSVHIRLVVSNSTSGHKFTSVSDAGLDRGIERISYHRSGASGHLTVVMVGQRLFVRGDEDALFHYIGWAPQFAAQAANSWVLVPRTSKVYDTMALGVEFRSAISTVLALAGTLTELPVSTVAGSRVIGLRRSGATTIGTTLYLRASGSPLPVAETNRVGSNTFTATYSRWNEPVPLATPVPKFIVR